LPAASIPSKTTTARPPVNSRACWMCTSLSWCFLTSWLFSSSLRFGRAGSEPSRIVFGIGSEYQRLGLAPLCQFAHLVQHRVGNRPVDLDQRDGVLARGRAAESEGRDVDPVVAQRGAEVADHPRLVLVGDIEHVGAKLRIDIDALDLHQARALFR